MTKPNTELHNLTIAELHSGLQQKQFSSHELTEHFLQRIAQLDTELNCFISVDAERALMLADEADQRSEERRVGKECRSRRSPYH